MEKYRLSNLRPSRFPQSALQKSSKYLTKRLPRLEPSALIPLSAPCGGADGNRTRCGMGSQPPSPLREPD